jgi:hypothetical protein
MKHHEKGRLITELYLLVILVGLLRPAISLLHSQWLSATKLKTIGRSTRGAESTIATATEAVGHPRKSRQTNSSANLI